MNRFGDKLRYQWKIMIFSYPTCITSPLRGIPSEFCHIEAKQKVKKIWNTFNHFDIKHEHDGWNNTDLAVLSVVWKKNFQTKMLINYPAIENLLKQQKFVRNQSGRSWAVMWGRECREVYGGHGQARSVTQQRPHQPADLRDPATCTTYATDLYTNESRPASIWAHSQAGSNK